MCFYFYSWKFLFLLSKNMIYLFLFLLSKLEIRISNFSFYYRNSRSESQISPSTLEIRDQNLKFLFLLSKFEIRILNFFFYSRIYFFWLSSMPGSPLTQDIWPAPSFNNNFRLPNVPLKQFYLAFFSPFFPRFVLSQLWNLPQSDVILTRLVSWTSTPKRTASNCGSPRDLSHGTIPFGWTLTTPQTSGTKVQL